MKSLMTQKISAPLALALAACTFACGFFFPGKHHNPDGSTERVVFAVMNDPVPGQLTAQLVDVMDGKITWRSDGGVDDVKTLKGLMPIEDGQTCLLQNGCPMLTVVVDSDYGPKPDGGTLKV